MKSVEAQATNFIYTIAT